ncbi:MAG: LptF/LptG family permease [Calditrichota bacterium]
MKILDRFIIRSYITKLTGAIIAATVIFLAIDGIEQFDRFIDNQVPTDVIIEYYYLFIPYIVYLVLPAATLLATLFTVGSLAMSNELTAIKVAGVPFTRILVLIIGISLGVAAGAFYLGESVIPLANQKREDIYRYKLKKMPVESRARQGRIYMQLAPQEHLYIDLYRSTTREAFGILWVTTKDGRILRRADAEKMVWRDDEWHLQGVEMRSFQPNGETRFERDLPLTISRQGLEPSEFEKIQTKPEEMNWKEMRDFIDKSRRMGGKTSIWEVELHSKIALPFAAVIIVLFGAPLASRRRRGGTALGFGLALFICFIYFGFVEVGNLMGYSGVLPPVLAAWLGNICFGVTGLGILLKTPS